MKRLSIAPRTPDWHAVRAESWTASAAAMLVARENAELLRDAAAAKGVTLDIAPLLKVGLDKFFENTPWSNWAEKVGRIPRFSGNEHTARGHENEERILQVFEQEQMFMVEREVTALSSEHSWLLASFDALAPASSDTSVSAPNGFPVEAKCPAFQSRKKLFDAKKAGGLYISGLPYYWCQVQHQILVADAPYGWFVAAGVEVNEKTGKEEVVFPVMEKVPRDDAFLKAYIAIAKFYFEEYVDSFIEPPMLPSDHRLLDLLAEKAAFDKAIAEADHDTAVELYLTALRQEEAAAERRKELEAKVVAAASAMREEGKDVVLLADRLQVTYSSTKTVSWQKVAKELVKVAGLPEIPPAVLSACENKARETVKLKEVA
ncbi:YqaJ viral recombinase family protein [Burkholderia multivorans]|uniref:YqaJ viral recombinase family protein n=1 Tax=Burkholderia multivorans TaxID=87883 RepID=UPI001C215AEC|nr:YqaJ viral recombinase family protein [Burkholderia multivorans]MBU9199960.1 YqaJ viral recombinase family protein [Burkholderia multivorans]MDN8078921.1 YqaJ viral recombinase family protein [Burkholderia multivorans]